MINYHTKQTYSSAQEKINDVRKQRYAKKVEDNKWRKENGYRTKREINAEAARDVYQGFYDMAQVEEDGRTVEQMMVDGIDQKHKIIDFIEETLPAFKAIKGEQDPETILSKASHIAAIAYVKNLMSSDPRIQMEAAKQVLDRSLGRPIERQMTVTTQVNQMTEREVENELNTLIGEFTKIEQPPEDRVSQQGAEKEVVDSGEEPEEATG